MENNKNKLMFICGFCNHKFSSAIYETVDFPEREDHPHDYISECEACGKQAKLNPMQLNLFKAWVKTANPRTGNALVNIREGNKRKDTSLSRFNGMTTGLHARVARFFPAKEGKYARCESCEYNGNGCAEMAAISSGACVKRTENFMLIEIATETNNPRMLNRIMSDTQAGMFEVISDMIAEIAQNGTVVYEPIWFNDKETGAVRLAKVRDPKTGEEVQLTEMKSHPLLKPLIDFVNKNDMKLSDMQMTNRQHEEEDELVGNLDDKEASLSEDKKALELFEQRQNILLEVGEQALEGLHNIGEPILINPDEGDQ